MKSNFLFALILFSLKSYSTGLFFDWNSNNDIFDSSFSQMFVRSTGQQSNQISDSSPTRRCFGELGCVEITDEFMHLIHRPFNLLPFDREKVNTRFSLYHRNRTVDPALVNRDKEHLLELGFDPQKPVKIIVHGFLDTGFSFWVVKLAQTLLLKGDFNVFAVDWGGGSLSLYTQATGNTRLVGLEIADYIRFLQRELGVNPENVHCIGHSLGAHTCGYAGHNLPGLGRITGLDPAEPYYQYLPEAVRLSPDDAKFVDVIHTDGRTILLLGFGMIQPCGHMDFYVNGGKDQPGCDLKEVAQHLDRSHGYEELQRDVFACSHHRAIYYWTEAVLQRCPFVGHICEDYSAYLRGDCWSCGENGSNCAIMGLDSDKFPIGNRSFVPFYLSTSNVAPFCVRHYRVSIELGWPGDGSKWVMGKVKLSMIGSRASIMDINLSSTENVRIQHGTTMSFIVQNPKELGVIERVKMSWKSGSCSSLWCNNSKLFVNRVKVQDIDQMDLSSSTTLCGNDEGQKYVAVSSGSGIKLDRRCS